MPRYKAPKTVLVTGTTSGIGRETVRRFAAAGWDVVATSRREGRPFPDLPKVVVVQMEQGDPASIDRAVAEAANAFGRLDVVVNNAGYCLMGPLEASSMDQIRRQYEVNVFGLMGVTKAALPFLKVTQGGIVNVASISADNGYPFNCVYSSSKAAVTVLTEGLNVELNSVGVFAKAVLPGLIATDIFTKLDAPEKMPVAYLKLWQQFLGMQRDVKGFAPEQVAHTIFKAATDGKVDRVRYYPTPDGSSVPTAKRLFGQDGYWRTFRKALLEGPTSLQKMMAPRGTRSVNIKIPKIEGV